jgi:cell division protease FtsH
MTTLTDAWLDAHRIETAALADEPLIALEHVEAEVRSLVARLADPEKAALLGAEVPRGILLHGSPGIGKTHTARNLAKRLGEMPVYEVVADELTGAIVRELFAALGARHVRSILVVDEVDLVGAQRADADAGTRRTLAALLTALDGLRTAAGVLVIAASSRPEWELDDALLRAGRLGFRIEIGYPGTADRAALLAHFLRGRPLTDDIDLPMLAERTPGWTPAELKAACADAAGLVMADGRDAIGSVDLLAALERAGCVEPAREEDPPLDRPMLRRVCIHEAAHMVVGAVVHGRDHIRSIRIGPESGTARFGSPGGSGEQEMDEHALRGALVVGLAGFAGERELLGGAVLGHDQDVEYATALARRLVAAGLQPSVPPLRLEGPERATAAGSRLVDAVAALMFEAREIAASVVAGRAAAVTAVADRLEAEAVRGLSVSPRPRSVEIDPAMVVDLLPEREAREPG